MYWLIFRISIYIVLCATIWYGGQFYSARETFRIITTSPSPAVFVDQNSDNVTRDAAAYFAHYDMVTQKILARAHMTDFTDIHTGNIIFPYPTITEALESAQKNNIHTIIIAPGTYPETLTIPDHMLVYGSGDVTILPTIPTSQKVITTGDGVTLLNLRTSGARYGITIPHNTSANIINVTASDARDYGIMMEYKDRPKYIPASGEPVPYEYYTLTEEQIDALPLVYFSNVTITHNGKQGMYLCDGRVTIKKSHIFENGEEGIDLHPHMIATISDTESRNNGESGSEMEIYDNIVSISNSTFTNNTKSGIAFLTSFGKGAITITDSTLTNNQAYGMRCAVHRDRPTSPRPFFQNVITKKNVINKDNALTAHSSDCFQF